MSRSSLAAGSKVVAPQNHCTGRRSDSVASKRETRRAGTSPPGAPRRPRPGSPRRAAPRPHAPDFERADRIGEFWGYPESRAFAELLIDCEEDRVLRAVLVGMLRESEGR